MVKEKDSKCVVTKHTLKRRDGTEFDINLVVRESYGYRDWLDKQLTAGETVSEIAEGYDVTYDVMLEFLKREGLYPRQ